MKKPSKRRTGPKIKCDAKLTAIVCEAIGQGAPTTVAVRVAGIDYKTHRAWLRTAEEIEDGRYSGRATKNEQNKIVRYANTFNLARANAEANLFDQIIRISKTDWRAAAWVLERCYGWHPKAYLEHTGRDGGPIATIGVNTNFDVTNPASAVDAMKWYKQVLQQPNSIIEDDA